MILLISLVRKSGTYNSTDKNKNDSESKPNDLPTDKKLAELELDTLDDNTWALTKVQRIKQEISRKSELITQWDGIVALSKKGSLSIERKFWQQLEEEDWDFIRAWNSWVAHKEDTSSLIPPNNITIKTKT